ncbi:MAG: nickel-responsive transcriptional regulator NikR [Sulfuricellaceae bacterium]
MERLTMSLTEELAKQFDDFIRDKGYTNRSEALRDLMRERLEQERLKASEDGGYCVAALTYVYNHHELDLAGRLAASHHEHHDLTLATQHVHLDHDNCLETVLLRGPVKAVRAFADGVIAERGVRHGKLHMIPVAMAEEVHSHGHVHSHPIT